MARTLDNGEEFSKSKSMELPRQIVVGHDAIHDVGAVCERLRIGKRALIVADPTTWKVAGQVVAQGLAEIGMKTADHQIAEASTEEVKAVSQELADQGMDFVLGVGGGRPIDVAKCASHDLDIPYLSVPTAASHDGIVSSRASILVNGVKTSIEARSPMAVVMDTNIIAQSPYKLLAAGCGDIMSNSTAVKDWVLARNLRNEYYSNYAASLSEMTAQMLIENAAMIRPGLEESAWFVAKALVSSGVAMSIAGSSRPASGAEHKFSHALDRSAASPGLHGEQCGIGTIMMMYLHGGNWQTIRESLMTIGAPTTARAMGVTEEEVIHALVKAHEIAPERYTILGDSGLTYEAAERLATITRVIG